MLVATPKQITAPYDYDWSKSHNGVMLCSFDKTVELMPEVEPIIEQLLESGMLEDDEDNYLVDVKVHMLIKGMFPCIPNWHRDFQPRNCDGDRDKTIKCDRKMYMWISGRPGTEYMRRDGTTYKKETQTWTTFTRNDMHRGSASEQEGTVWRAFIRVIPKDFVHTTTINVGEIRRHCQVYLPETYKW